MSLFQNLASSLQNKIQKVEQTLDSAITVFGKQLLDAEGNGTENDIQSQNIPPDDGINQNLLEFVRNIAEHPKTFTDFPLDPKEPIIQWTQWQIRHCRVILEVSQQKN